MYWYADMEDRKIKLNTFLGAGIFLIIFFFFNIVQFQKVSIGVWGGGVCKSKKCKKKSIPESGGVVEKDRSMVGGGGGGVWIFS